MKQFQKSTILSIHSKNLVILYKNVFSVFIFVKVKLRSIVDNFIRLKSKKTKVLDFSGQNIFIGLDVHSKNWSVTLHSEGFKLKTYSQALQAFILLNCPGAKYKAVYEAGFCGFTIQRAFEAQGIKGEVIHAADVQTSDKKNRKMIKLIAVNSPR